MYHDHPMWIAESSTSFDGVELTDEQLDGRACVWCEVECGEMIPIANGPRGQLMIHPECAEERENE